MPFNSGQHSFFAGFFEATCHKTVRSRALLRPSVTELSRLIEIGLRPRTFTLFMIRDSTVVVRSRITGIQKNRFVEIADRVVVLIFVIAGHATVVVGSGLSGIQK